MVSGIFVLIALVVGSVQGNYCAKHSDKCKPADMQQSQGE